jgi:hypothetical protein
MSDQVYFRAKGVIGDCLYIRARKEITEFHAGK